MKIWIKRWMLLLFTMICGILCIKVTSISVFADTSNIVIIGDSRTVGMCMTVTGQPYSVDYFFTDSNGITWDCKGGMGLNWTKNTGVPRVNSMIGEGTQVVILMGVNDAFDQMAVGFAGQYCEYINEKAFEWKSRGAKTYFVSVNPIEDLYTLNGYTISPQSPVNFNNMMLNGLSSDVEYIDTFNQINGHVAYADKIHYLGSTYTEIYNLIIQYLAKSGSGIQHSGEWVEYGNQKVYFDSEGKKVKGIQTIDDTMYHFNDIGYLAGGWGNVNGTDVYFGDDGKVFNGWKVIENDTYYFINGIKVVGPQNIDGTDYYFNSDGKYTLGLVNLPEGTRYYTNEGIFKDGWQVAENSKYYFKDSIALTGKQNVDNKEVIFDKTGKLVTGWVVIDKNKYYSNGVEGIVKGWKNLDGQQFYFNDNGIMVKGKNNIKGKEYYFLPNGFLVKDTVIVTNGVTYTTNAEGICE